MTHTIKLHWTDGILMPACSVSCSCGWEGFLMGSLDRRRLEKEMKAQFQIHKREFKEGRKVTR